MLDDLDSDLELSAEMCWLDHGELFRLLDLATPIRHYRLVCLAPILNPDRCESKCPRQWD